MGLDSRGVPVLYSLTMGQAFNQGPRERQPLAPGQVIPQEIKAVVLAEAAWLGDKAACEKYGISERSLQRIRRAAGTDVAMLQSLAVKQRQMEKRWMEDIDVTIGGAVRTINFCAEEVRRDPRAAKNPEMIKALSSAAKTLADIKLANRVIDARLRQIEGANVDEPVDEEHLLKPGEVEIAPGVIICSPELNELEEMRNISTESSSIIDLTTDSADISVSGTASSLSDSE